MLLSQKEIGKLENLRPLLKKARKNNCNTEIYKHEKKNQVMDHLLICMALWEPSNDKHLGRATAWTCDWIWKERTVVVDRHGEEKWSILSSLVITFTERWYKIFIQYLIQSLVRLTSFLDSPPSVYRRITSSWVLFIWLTSFSHLFSVLIHKDLKTV